MTGFTFHYFHGNGHIPCQGSLSADQFEIVLEHLSSHFKVISADEFLYDLRSGKNDPSEMCLCFDCGLRSQFDIARPILERRNITAFWFLYTNVFQGEINKIEAYHYFRFSCFASVDDFYDTFFSIISDLYPEALRCAKREIEEKGYLNWADFYTYNDRLFKFLRDRVLSELAFDSVMAQMMQEKSFNIETDKQHLWLDKKDVKNLVLKGNIVGMHTHTHPNDIGSLPYRTQFWEYSTCQTILQEITGCPVTTMSHPCNSYNEDTFKVLNALGIEYGFRSDIALNRASRFEIPRIDHASWIRNHKGLKIWQ